VKWGRTVQLIQGFDAFKTVKSQGLKNWGICLQIAFMLGSALAFGDNNRNAYLLPGTPYYYHGYDWWWHSFVGTQRSTGQQRPFYIQYFVVNPGLGGARPIFGQIDRNRRSGLRPSYARVTAGSWGDGAVQLHRYYGIDDLQASTRQMDVRIGENIATENRLRGSVNILPEEKNAHPEWLSDAGEMSWDLSLRKDLTYSVGYAASRLFRMLYAFEMFWHVEGMKTSFEGTVTYQGEIFDVRPDESFGYQDKNWGSDYTNPWIWISCNRFQSEKTGQLLPMTSLAVGGGRPKAFGVSLGNQVLIAFHHEGVLYDWNFTKFWRRQKQMIDIRDMGSWIHWKISSKDSENKIEIDFSSPKQKMIKIRIEDPDGERLHQQLWNGAYLAGTVKLYRKHASQWELIDTFKGTFGGGEFGSY
jgi:tocopherol cyclase